MPRDPTEVGGGGAASGENAGSADNKGGRESTGAGVAAAGGNRPQQQQQQQQQLQLLEDLATPAKGSSLPGTGIPFVEDGDEAAEERGGGGGGGGGGRGADADGGKGGGGGSGGVRGAGRTLSVFEAKALQKARARQRDRMEAGEPQVSRPAGRVGVRESSGLAILKLQECW